MTVGDVVGHGLAAAAAMGQLRTALAALSAARRRARRAPHSAGRFPGEVTDDRLRDRLLRGARPRDRRPRVRLRRRTRRCSSSRRRRDRRWLDGGRSAPLYGGDGEPRPQARRCSSRARCWCSTRTGSSSVAGRLTTGLERLSEAGGSLAGCRSRTSATARGGARGAGRRARTTSQFWPSGSRRGASSFRRVFPAAPEELRDLRASMRAWLAGARRRVPPPAAPAVRWARHARTRSSTPMTAARPARSKVEIACRTRKDLSSLRSATRGVPRGFGTERAAARARNRTSCAALTTDFSRESTAAGHDGTIPRPRGRIAPEHLTMS